MLWTSCFLLESRDRVHMEFNLNLVTDNVAEDVWACAKENLLCPLKCAVHAYFACSVTFVNKAAKWEQRRAWRNYYRLWCDLLMSKSNNIMINFQTSRSHLDVQQAETHHLVYFNTELDICVFLRARLWYINRLVMSCVWNELFLLPHLQEMNNSSGTSWFWNLMFCVAYCLVS
jgi:hypothetical protein